MEYLVKITPTAEQSLEDIIYFIALDSPARAYSFADELVDAFRNTLSLFPQSGVVYQGEIRKFTHKGYTAFYRIKPAEKLVEILHIVNLAKPLLNHGIDFDDESAED